MKVYIVEFGEYSSRYVSGVYSTRENAGIGARGDGDIEEFELDPCVDEHRSGLRVFSVHMAKDATVTKVENWGHWTNKAPEFRVGFCYPLGVRPATMQFEAILWAKSEEQAIKATSEALAQAIASGEWNIQEAKQMEIDKRYGNLFSEEAK